MPAPTQGWTWEPSPGLQCRTRGLVCIDAEGDGRLVPEPEGMGGAAVQASNGPAGDLLRRGQTAARRGERTRARRLLRAALIADPTNTEARLWLAALAEDPREAVEMLSEILEEHPGHVRAAAGLRWAWERLEAQSAARCVAPPPALPRLQPLPASPRPHLLTRVATAIACLASIFAVIALVSCGLPGQVGQAAPVVDAAIWTPEPTVVAPTPEPPTPTPTPTMAPPTATPSPTARPQPTATPLFTGKWIEVSLKQQTATAWEGATAVRRMVVSTGAARTPTIQGTYRIYLKLTKQNMSGPGYYLPNVPHVMYFSGSYALHGAYWHTNFGTPTSHGCINLSLDDAAWLFAWADPQLPKGAQNVYATAANPGTPVVIHP